MRCARAWVRWAAPVTAYCIMCWPTRNDVVLEQGRNPPSWPDSVLRWHRTRAMAPDGAEHAIRMMSVDAAAGASMPERPVMRRPGRSSLAAPPRPAPRCSYGPGRKPACGSRQPYVQHQARERGVSRPYLTSRLFEVLHHHVSRACWPGGSPPPPALRVQVDGDALLCCG